MADRDTKNTKDNTTGQKTGEQRQNMQQQSTAMQTARQEGQQRGLARGGMLPSLNALSPLDILALGPFELMRLFTNDLDRTFENFGLSRRSGVDQIVNWSPPIDVFERDGKLVVHAELPGMDADNVRVEITNDGLVISGEKVIENEDRREGVYRRERAFGRFYRVIPLPDDVNIDQVDAQFNNGVLEVVVPLPEERNRRREIPISAGESRRSQAAAAGTTATGGTTTTGGTSTAGGPTTAGGTGSAGGTTTAGGKGSTGGTTRS